MVENGWECWTDIKEQSMEKPKIGEKWRVRKGLVDGMVYGVITYRKSMKRDFITVKDFMNNGGIYVEEINKVYSLEMLDGRIEEPKETEAKVVEKPKKIKLKMSQKKLATIQMRICLGCANKEILDARPNDIETKKYCEVCECNLSRYKKERK